VDWTSIALFAGMLVALTLQLGALRDDIGVAELALRWTATLAIAAAFVRRQTVSLSPAAEWSLFRVRSFTAATAYILLTNLTMYTTLLLIPFFVRDVLDKSTQQAGLLLGAMSVLVAIVAPLGGRMSDAVGRRAPAQIGAVLMLAAAIALLAGLSSDVSAAYLAACLALVGLGLGLGVGAANTAAVESAPRALAGSAAGTSSMMRYAGSIIGAGILAGGLSDNTGGSDVTTFRLVMLAIISTAALAVVASMFIHRFAAVEAAAISAETMLSAT
jgi:MFS family permease